jgi:hypothetical protein
MHILHHISQNAVNEALANFYGYLLSRSSGYSLAACGFSHAGLVKRVAFPGLLSFKSKCKKLLTYTVYFLIFQALLLLCTIPSSVEISPKVMREDTGTLACIVYYQDGEIYDRGYPNPHGLSHR